MKASTQQFTSSAIPWATSSENPRFVETLPRRGYRFIASVEEVHPKKIRVHNLLTLAACSQRSAGLLFGLNLAERGIDYKEDQ